MIIDYTLDDETKRYQQQQEVYLRKNFFFYIKAACIISPLWAIIDTVMGERSFFLYLAIRCSILIPFAIMYQGTKRNIFKNIYPQVVIMILMVAASMSTSSFFISGLKSHYYNGLLLLSFIQFTVMPTQIKYLTFTDILLVLIYFPLNYFPFDIDIAFLMQQVASFSTYAVAKFIAANRGYGLIFESFSKYSNQREVDQHRNISELFMELCYLISNPLFISQSYLNKALKSRDSVKKDEYMEKSLSYHYRMNNVVKRMQEFNQKNTKLKEYKEYFSIDDEAVNRNEVD